MHNIQYPPQLTTLNTMLIDGVPVAVRSGAQIDVRDPATSQVNGSLPRASASDENHAVQYTGQTMNGAWRKFDPTARAHILHEIARRIRKRAALSTQIETIDVGKPLSQAERDVGRAARLL